MPILPGRRLGPYEILSAIGAGGMGEVYKARDTRLDRTVAIKILPGHLADRSNLRERFDREAKTIASLNHPHICTLYDVGRDNSTDYLVMEYIEGETLAQRLAKGPLPLEQTLQYSVEIADALDKAHRKGITHRDLKPGNIMLTKTGTKLLDFGLAKLKQEAAPTIPDSQLPTLKSAITGEGTILGTLQYMAPEQVEGKEADTRTDIFAFGAVVYEMATGKRAFEGKSSASVMAKIMEAEPPSMASLQPVTPPALERTVRHCLAKEPDDRWQTARDLEVELKWIAECDSRIGVASVDAAKGARTAGRRSLIFNAGALLSVAIVTGFAIWNLKPVPMQPNPVTRFAITLPPGQQLAVPDTGPAVVLSPDGTHLVYLVREGGNRLIYLRAMDSLEAKPIPGTDLAINPFFSADSQWLGFGARNKLKKVSVGGVSPLDIIDNRAPYGASWDRQGNIVFGNYQGPLMQVSDTGGTPQPLTHLEKGETSHAYPDILPGGKAVLFSASPSGSLWTNAQVAIQPSGTGERRTLFQGGMYPHYALSGHIVYSQAGTLIAVPFDPRKLTVTGAAIPVIEGVQQSITDGDAQYSFSNTGTLAYIPGNIQFPRLNLVWVSRNGTEQRLATPVHAYLQPRISPDGRQVAVGIGEQERQVWLYDFARETMTRFTFQGTNNLVPFWTPDGKKIVFVSNKEGSRNLYWQKSDGSGGLERLTTSEFLNIPGSWSPDGQLLAFSEVNAATGYDIWVLHTSDRKAQPFLRTQFNEAAPEFSPDGHWLAYASNESGRSEIFIQPYPGPGGSGKSRQTAEWNPCGTGMVGSFSTATASR